MAQGDVAIEENNEEYGHHVQVMNCSLERAIFFFNNRVTVYESCYAWFVMTLFCDDKVVGTARKVVGGSVVTRMGAGVEKSV